MKGKILSLFLVITISFSWISFHQQKKANAAALTSVFLTGVAYSGFLTYAAWFYANGYHIPINNLIVGYANKFYDHVNGEYLEKGSEITTLDKMKMATANMLLLGQADYMPLSELEAIKESISNEYNTKQNLDELEISQNVLNGPKLTGYMTIDQGVIGFTSEYNNKIIKFQSSADNPDYYVLIDFNALSYTQRSGYLAPNIRVYAPNGNSYIVGTYTTMEFSNLTPKSFTFRTTSGGSNIISWFNTYRDNYIPSDPTLVDYVPQTFATRAHDFVYSFPKIQSLLSGKASNVEELENLINTDEYLQNEINKALEDTVPNVQNDLVVPEVGTDGKLYYPTADIPDVPDNPYSPSETWYNDLLGWITNIPDLFIGGITDLFNETLIPALDSLKDIVFQIPDLLTNIWQWILDFPDLLYSWFVPTVPAIAETWQPVIDLWDFKLDPIIAPFKTLTFYETEYQDISVPLKFGSYEKEHKIIDFQYIKSQRDTIKSLIRAFLWILIIFFNLDQIHRLIRNQSLLNTYVRKIDKGA